MPVLSFQWEKPAPEYERSRDTLGAVRYRYLEPAGFLADQGARTAFGSDWPVDRLDEWFDLKVGVTREADPSPGPNYRGRLSDDRGLTQAEVVRAATINAAYELHQDDQIGSLEVGKLADLIVLDRNLFTIAPEEIAHIKVLETVVGGKLVYSAKAPQTSYGTHPK
jgi:predicted amidohydrolase YtcJ